jgi:hypothetical protein
MRKHVLIAPSIMATLLAMGCAPKTMYEWHGYDDTLYSHYKDPAKQEENLARLQELVQKNEHDQVKMPPGVYADCGYALLEAGRATEAIVCFEKERSAWPESTVLMEKLIRNVNLQTRSNNKTPTVQGTEGQMTAPASTSKGDK